MALQPARAPTRPRPLFSAAQGVRAEVGKPLQQAADYLKAGKAKEALAKVREADAVGGKTAAEQLRDGDDAALRRFAREAVAALGRAEAAPHPDA